MTKEEQKELAAQAFCNLKELDSDDIEVAHIEADKILCELIRDLGHVDVAGAFNALRKWYA